MIIKETIHVRTDIDNGKHKINDLDFDLDFKAGRIVQIIINFINGMEGTVQIKPQLLRSAQETPRDILKSVTDDDTYKGWIAGEDIDPNLFVNIPFSRDDILRTQVKCDATITVTYPVQLWYVVEYEM